MTIVGCDFHPSWQQVAAVDVETGELKELRLLNGNGEAETFYRGLPVPSLIGIEACGNSQWLIELLQPQSLAGRKATQYPLWRRRGSSSAECLQLEVLLS